MTLQFKGFRVRQFDANNLIIEERAMVKNGPAGQSTEGWRFVGYYGTLRCALVAISDRLPYSEEKFELEDYLHCLDEFRIWISENVRQPMGESTAANVPNTAM